MAPIRGRRAPSLQIHAASGGNCGHCWRARSPQVDPKWTRHSDQGCTYASEDYQTLLATRGITCSMSRRGNCHDNAVMESFFSTVKSELADRFPSFGEAKMELFDYIEVFYNQRRRHSTLGQISPAVFERRATQAAQLNRPPNRVKPSPTNRPRRYSAHADGVKCINASICDGHNGNPGQNPPDGTA